MLGSNQRRLSRRFYRPLSFCTSQSAADQRICAVKMRLSISRAFMTLEFEELARPRTGSREATDGAGGSGYVDRPPPNARRLGAPFTAQASRMRGRRQPQLITSSTCQRQRLSRCSWQRVPRVPCRPGYQGLLLVPGLRGPEAQLHGDDVRPRARGAAAGALGWGARPGVMLLARWSRPRPMVRRPWLRVAPRGHRTPRWQCG